MTSKTMEAGSSAFAHQETFTSHKSRLVVLNPLNSNTIRL